MCKVSESKVEVNASSSIIGLSHSTADDKILDSVLGTLGSHDSFHVVTKRLALVPWHRRFKRFGDDSIIQSEILKNREIAIKLRTKLVDGVKNLR